MKQQFLKDRAGTIKLLIYQDNRPVVPTSATITVYKPGSDTAFIAETAATVNATTGEMSYALTSTHTATNDLNYKASWSYVVSGVTYYQDMLFDVVRSMLAIPLVDEDLYDEMEDLRKDASQVTGTATAGAAGSLTDTSRGEADNYWKGGTIEIIAGTGNKQQRDITSFTQSTGVVAVSPNWTTTPDTTSVYRLVRSFTKQIKLSFEKISTMLYNKGQRHSLILESSQIKIPLLYLTIHFICLDLMKETEDIWHTRANTYWDKFNTEFGNMKLEYDSDDSGTISGTDEEMSSPGEFRIYRA